MKKIENGFLDDYYLTQQGQVFNIKKREFRKPYSDFTFKLKCKDGNVKTISLKSLYKLVFNKTYCIDNIISESGQYWRKYKDTDYWISSFGNIKSYKRYKAIILKPFQNRKNGYYQVKIGSKNIFVHKLVAEMFLSKPLDYDQKNYQIHHKDGNNKNNAANNLEYVTKEQHIKIHNS